jgi:hypothetical protein
MHPAARLRSLPGTRGSRLPRHRHRPLATHARGVRSHSPPSTSQAWTKAGPRQLDAIDRDDDDAAHVEGSLG